MEGEKCDDLIEIKVVGAEMAFSVLEYLFTITLSCVSSLDRHYKEVECVFTVA